MKLTELAKQINAHLSKPMDVEINTIAALSQAGPDAVSFLTNARYADQLAKTNAAAVIVTKDFADDGITRPLLRVANVQQAIAEVLQLFAPADDFPDPGVHQSAVVDKTAKLGQGVAIGANAVIGAHTAIGDNTVILPGCVIGKDVTIGSNCIIYANVTIRQRCTVGDNVIIHDGTAIGADGFGYNFIEGEHRKIPHIGIVSIEDNVEIGANCCIDRAKFGQTIIGTGSKIDNLVQIGHNVNVGKNCILVSQVGIAGSTTLGNFVVLAGQVGIADHLNIGDGAQIGAQAGIDRDVKPGEKLIGGPAVSPVTFFRHWKAITQLPEMMRELKKFMKNKNVES